ncbi:flavin reductase family protein [Kitasatospora sp. NBC_00458]|uniref:flavin reductase family protein n=1 Tax=Kitasatospora sp. NBC_00458 TaxID=2903568 RepID=UPI002E17C88A
MNADTGTGTGIDPGVGLDLGTGTGIGSGPGAGAAVDVPAAPTADPLALRRVYGAFPTGVTALAALVDGEPVGMTASSFVTVSLDPPLVSVCAALTSSTWPRLRRAARLGVSVLGGGQEGVCRQLAARGVERFAGLDWHRTGEGAVLLDGSCAWFDCSVEREVAAGDHRIVLLRVHGLGGDPQAPPLVFHGSRYRRLA